MKFLKTVKTIVLICVLGGIVSYKISSVKSNLNNGADNVVTAILGQGDDTRQVAEKTNAYQDYGILSDNSINIMTMLCDVKCEELVEKYDISVRSEYKGKGINNVYGTEFAEFDIYIEGTVYRKIYIRPTGTDFKIIYKDGTETTFIGLIGEIENELIKINERAKEQIKEIKNSSPLVPETIIEEDLPSGLFGSAGEESWHQAVEPLGDPGFETYMSESDALDLVQEVFPESTVELLEIRELDYVFSVISNNTGDPADNIYHEYTVPNNFPEIYDLSGNCIYSR